MAAPTEAAKHAAAERARQQHAGRIAALEAQAKQDARLAAHNHRVHTIQVETRRIAETRDHRQCLAAPVRPRGAGRPGVTRTTNRTSTRSSAASGDSGSDPPQPGEKPRHISLVLADFLAEAR